MTQLEYLNMNEAIGKKTTTLASLNSFFSPFFWTKLSSNHTFNVIFLEEYHAPLLFLQALS